MRVNFSQKQDNKVFQDDIKCLFNLAVDVVKIPNDICVNIIDVSEKKIQRLNKQYRNVDRVTDVLSFPMLDNIDEISLEQDFKYGECNIGDIYINPNRVVEQAMEYGHSYRREYCFLALHGFLHLLGYDHMTKQDEKIMFDLQNQILNLANIKR